ncbi:MAG TPA: metallophosphoesterase family protein, partial [Tabrizicola sp.]|nr:metallophosphoesterase family protein [Tabrizicola sp.]
MRFAVLTDIHANREAFEAVLADVAGHGADRIVLLGDIVGYGAEPEWCCDRAEALVAEGAICVRGNHDNAAAGAAEAMSSLAKRALDWTSGRLSAAQKAFLGGLPYTAEAEGVLFVHASASQPEAWSYVTSDTRAAPSFRACKARVILCGHVHVPMLASCDIGGVVREQAFRPGLPIPLLPSRRWLAVVGSVGQPRDGVAQAAWALVDTARQELT